jgi:GxxExxY protein
MSDIIYNEESYLIIGICMEVRRILGKGHSEVVCRDAIEYELLKKGVLFAREKKYEVEYKDIILPHFYFADFVVLDKIILEIKAVECLASGSIKQTLNYLATSRLKLGLLVNFGEDSLTYKRIVL